jgi:hypothetical protein
MTSRVEDKDLEAMGLKTLRWHRALHQRPWEEDTIAERKGKQLGVVEKHLPVKGQRQLCPKPKKRERKEIQLDKQGG